MHLPEGSGRFGTQARQTVRTGFDDAVRPGPPGLQVAGVDAAALDGPAWPSRGGAAGATRTVHTASCSPSIPRTMASRSITCAPPSLPSCTRWHGSGDDDIALAVADLDEDPADDGRWFCHAGGLLLWFGYTLGYRWARDYAAAQGSQASDLVHTSATAIATQAENCSGVRRLPDSPRSARSCRKAGVARTPTVCAADTAGMEVTGLG